MPAMTAAEFDDRAKRLAGATVEMSIKLADGTVHGLQTTLSGIAADDMHLLQAMGESARQAGLYSEAELSEMMSS